MDPWTTLSQRLPQTHWAIDYSRLRPRCFHLVGQSDYTPRCQIRTVDWLSIYAFSRCLFLTCRADKNRKYITYRNAVRSLRNVQKLVKIRCPAPEIRLRIDRQTRSSQYSASSGGVINTNRTSRRNTYRSEVILPMHNSNISYFSCSQLKCSSLFCKYAPAYNIVSTKCCYILIKHQWQRAQATYMPVK